MFFKKLKLKKNTGKPVSGAGGGGACTVMVSDEKSVPKLIAVSPLPTPTQRTRRGNLKVRERTKCWGAQTSTANATNATASSSILG